VPAALAKQTPFQKTLSNTFKLAWPILDLVGEMGSQDDRVYAKLHKLITEPNSDPLLRKFAIHAQQQIDSQTQLGVQGH